MSAGAGSLKYEIQQNKPFHSLSHEAVLGLLKTTDLVRRVISSVVEPAGVSMQQYNVLRILRGSAPEPLPTLTIRTRMIEQTPGITRLLDKLQKGGWVSRERCKDDRRQVLCSITAKGKALVDGLDEPIERIYGRLLGHVPEQELRTLVRAMDRLRAAEADAQQLTVDSDSAA